MADAVVGVVVSCTGIASSRSNEQGNCTLRVPAEAPLQDIYAFKSGQGLDYLTFPKADRATTADLPQPPDLSRPVTMKLIGARRSVIKLVDPKGQPIAGVRVSPWYFQKPEWRHGDDLNIDGVQGFEKKSDSKGVVVFDWIPSWDKQYLIFWPSGGDRWTRSRIIWQPDIQPAEKTLQLQRTVPIRGQVRHADGRPAADIAVQCREARKSLESMDFAAKRRPTRKADLRFASIRIRPIFLR